MYLTAAIFFLKMKQLNWKLNKTEEFHHGGSGIIAIKGFKDT